MGKRAEYLGPEKRRPLVLDAAREIFAAGGFADASMAAIAEHAGVCKAVLYDCFPGGKQEIYYSLLDREEQVFSEHVTRAIDETFHLPLEESLRVGLTSFLRYAEADPLGFRVIFGDAGTADPEIARRTRQVKDRMVEQLGARARTVIAATGAPDPPAAGVFPRAIIAVAEELARWLLRDPSVPSAAVVELTARWFMHGFEQVVLPQVWDRADLGPAPA
ncbi:MAG: TetR/AcrR family transcriptional regulator [Actinomycetota bacterium]